MQKIIFYVAALLCTFLTQIYGQETFEQQAKVIANSITSITTEEKTALKAEVEEINKLLESGTITATQADEKKLKAAEERARNIERRIAAEQAKLDDLVKDQVDGKFLSSTDSSSVNNKKVIIQWDLDDDDFKGWKCKSKSERRTTSQFVFAFGLNNLITDGDSNSLENSDFKTWGSNFFEWGFTFNTRILKENNLLHIKYGLSLMYNNLRPTDNRYFVKDGDVTELQTFDRDLNENKFRNSMVVLPVHLEFDFTPKTVGDDGVSKFRTHKSVRLGVGGFGGLNYQSTQKLRYEEDDIRIKNKQKGDFNVSTFVYGLSGYLGYGSTSLYVKYNLNSLFKDNPIDQNNISLGLRFDLN
ncbi:hypothetical protein [Flavobacterium sp.]|uniref:hypothetical protein n=1 Tax=Flavobacterium sp. TaxID=239 RepID=UPI0025BB1AC5|nr:hypothetical protein [Flavobacterium sp.]MBA4152959.1 hypothetical protein [Flavobacterium sp.]